MDAKLSEIPFLKHQENWPAIANTAFRRLATDAVTEAKSNIDPSKSGLHNRSGLLRGSIKLRRFIQVAPGGTGEAVIAAGNSRVPYAAIHERGGVIRAKNKSHLVFKIGNRWIRKKQVTIPARPYLQPAIDDKSQVYERYVMEAIEEIIKAL